MPLVLESALSKLCRQENPLKTLISRSIRIPLYLLPFYRAVWTSITCRSRTKEIIHDTYLSMANSNTPKGREFRGLGLQCPFSNCFPQHYQYSRAPCVLTSFADFREVVDHIWKYHSFILSCKYCDHRFSNGNRGEQARKKLLDLKAEHEREHHSPSKVAYPIPQAVEISG